MKKDIRNKILSIIIAFLLVFTTLDSIKGNVYAGNYHDDSIAETELVEDEEQSHTEDKVDTEINSEEYDYTTLEKTSESLQDQAGKEIRTDGTNSEVQETLNTNVSLEFIQAQYLTGAEISMDLKMNILPGEMKDNDTIRILIPKNYVIKDTIYTQTTILGNLPTLSENESFYIIEYTMFDVENGFNGTYPYKFQTYNKTTPDNHLKVKVEYIKNDVLEFVENTTEIVNETPTVTKMIQDGNNNFTSNLSDNLRLSVGQLDSVDRSKLSENLSELEYVTYSFNLEPVNSNKGNRTYEKLEITDILPEYAHFNPAANPGWSLSEDGKTVVYVHNETVDLTQEGSGEFTNKIILKLKFPGAPKEYKANNTIKVKGHPINPVTDEEPQEMSDDINVILANTISCLNVSRVRRTSNLRYDYDEDRKEPYLFQSRFINESETTMSNLRFSEFFVQPTEDNHVTEKIIFTSIRLMENDIQGDDKAFKLEIIHEDNSKQELGSFDFDPDRIINLKQYHEPNNRIKEIVFTFAQGTYLNPGQDFRYQLGLEIENPDENIIPEDFDSSHWYYRTRFRFTFDESQEGYNDCKGDGLYFYTQGNTFREPLLEIKNLRTSANNTVISILNDEVNYRISLNAKNLSNQLPTPLLDNVELKTTLPIGIDYLAGSAQIQLGDRISSIDIDSQPEIIENQDGTKTLKWKIPEFLINAGSGDTTNLINIDFKTTLSYGMLRGINESVASLVYDEASIFNVKENDGESKATFNYQPATESSFWVMSSDRSNLDYQYNTELEKGKTFNFKYSILNIIGEPMTDSMALVFVPDNAKLLQPVLEPKGYHIEYTTTKKMDNVSEKDYYNNSTIWSDSITDFNEVKAFKLSLNGEIFGPAELIELTASYQLKDIFDDSINVNNNIFVALRASGDMVGSIVSNVDLMTEKVYVEKIWNDSENRDRVRPSEVEIKLSSSDTSNTLDKTIKLNEFNDWNHEFIKLPFYNDDTLLEYGVVEKPVDYYESYTQENSKHNFTVINVYEAATKDVNVNVVWEDGNDQDGVRPEKVVVKLLADGVEAGLTLDISAQDNWQGSFEDVFVNKDGVEIAYTISYDIIDSYTTDEVFDKNTNTYIITHKRELETKDINVNVVWEDGNDQDGVRPEKVVVKLLADGVETGLTLDLSAQNNWQGAFEDVFVNKDGVEIEYTVDQDILIGYETTHTINDNHFTITNLHHVEKVDISLEKLWVDQNNKDGIRPTEVTIRLIVDGQYLGTEVKLTKNGGWTGSFIGLDKYANGTLINYSIEEESVSGYTTSIQGNIIDGFEIINSHEVNEDTDNSNNGKFNNGNSPATGLKNTYTSWLALLFVSVTLLFLLKQKQKSN